MDEFIDIVDEEDRVLYQVSKVEAHEKGLLHRTVISELINSRGEWISVKQASDRQDPGQYVSPMGGHVVAGETEEEALKREILEELGISEFDYKLVGKGIFRRYVRNRDENHYFILYEAYSDVEPTLNEESVDYKKFTQDDLSREMKRQPKQFGDAFHFVVKRFYPHFLDL